MGTLLPQLVLSDLQRLLEFLVPNDLLAFKEEEEEDLMLVLGGGDSEHNNSGSLASACDDECDCVLRVTQPLDKAKMAF